MELRQYQIVLVTRSLKRYTTRVEVSHDDRKGCIILDKIRTADRQRIVLILSSLIDKEVQKVKLVLKETYVD